MPRRQSRSRRLATAARWPAGIALTAWSYMWRTTPMHRSQTAGSLPDDGPPPLPPGVADEDVQFPEHGAGALFHRRYRTRIRDAQCTPEELIGYVTSKPDRVVPTEMATFQKVHGDDERMAVGDEFLVRMPGPWDGPVRVVDVTASSFRLVTLDGHLEAGQIEFSAERDDGLLAFRIESWARSGDRLSDLLYDRVRMAKEIQLHMWTSVLERVVRASGGRMTGGIEIRTRRADAG